MKQRLKKLSFFNAYKMYWKKAFKFKGRSRRKEMWVMFNRLFLFYLIFLSALTPPYWLGYYLYCLLLPALVVTFIPNISLCCRRSADINVNPIFAIILYLLPTMIYILCFIFESKLSTSTFHTFVLIALISFAIRIIGIIILMCIPGKKGETKYGKDPKYFFFDESIDENIYEYIKYVVNQRKKYIYPYNVIKNYLINNKGLSAEESDVIIIYALDNYDELKLVF